VVPKDEIFEIAETAFKDALKMTLKSKIKGILRTIFSIVKISYKFFSYILETSRKYGKDVFKIWLKDIRSAVVEKVETIKNIWKSMDSKQKFESLIDISVFGITTLLVAGGFDLEGGLPDTDLRMGIGSHRNLFTHTILIGLLLEFVVRFLVNLTTEAYKRGYLPNYKLFEAFVEFGKKYEKTVISGLWFGLFLHFLKDANIFSGKMKPYVGISGQTMQTHKNIMTTNAILSAIFTPKNEVETN
jgi:hypothetical protein